MKNYKINKSIFLGNIHIKNWKCGDPLYSEWMKDYPEEYGEFLTLNPREKVLENDMSYVLIMNEENEIYKEKLRIDDDITREKLIEFIIKSYNAHYEEYSDLILQRADINDHNEITVKLC